MNAIPLWLRYTLLRVLLFAAPDAVLMRKHLQANGIAVRRCDTFVGLGPNYLRVAVRPEWPMLVDAVAEVLR